MAIILVVAKLVAKVTADGGSCWGIGRIVAFAVRVVRYSRSGGGIGRSMYDTSRMGTHRWKRSIPFGFTFALAFSLGLWSEFAFAFVDGCPHRTRFNTFVWFDYCFCLCPSPWVYLWRGWCVWWPGYRSSSRPTLVEVELFDGASPGRLNCLVVNLGWDKKLGNVVLTCNVHCIYKLKCKAGWWLWWLTFRLPWFV
jgi:hypothetical protein